MKRLLLLPALLAPVIVVAQFDSGNVIPGSVPSEGPIAPLLAPLAARSIGPVNMGGRIMDIAVYEKEPRIFYVASASGGVFKTVNAGLTFEPIFDHESTVSLGAVAVSATNPDIVWVGTGEQSSRNSVAWGDGVYKSTDGGKTWTHVGLVETRHISHIWIDPKDPDTVIVGALGRLWGPNPERGIYKTTDAGKTWKQTLALDSETGIIDLKVDPSNPRVMLAAAYQRRRLPYDFISGGPSSALYKSTDGGNGWRRLRRGLPTQLMGRIGISYFRKDPKVIIATIEYKIDKKQEDKDKIRRPADNGETKNYAGGTFKSTDGGESWKRINFLNPRPFYFSTPAQDPTDAMHMYVLGDSMHVSADGGKTFKDMNIHVHADNHVMWIDPSDDFHMMLGTDGGAFETNDRGATWRMFNNLPIGQFYAVAFDFRKPYWVYGGLQDNGSWGLPTQTDHGGVSFFDAVGVGGGDGFHCEVDPNDWSTVYSESQGGALSRFDMIHGTNRYIQPRAAKGEKLRFNWSTPIALSPFNSQTLYIGANRLFKSVDRGDHWQPISPDLTTNDPIKERAGALSVTPEDTGAETHCTIITISESPRKQGTIYVGTDDGNVQVTQDGGFSWTNVTQNIPGLPANTWCSRVQASKYADGRIYATFDGHRSNDFKPYLYVSEDFGKTWKSLSGSLPDFDSLYVITEGQKNPDLLFLGSELGLRISLDRGATWTKYRSNFPTVAVHEVRVHPRDEDLVIATHGRSLWTLDVSALDEMTPDKLAADAAIYHPQPIYLLGRVTTGIWDGDGVFLARNTQPGCRIMYTLKQPVKGDVEIVVSDAGGEHTVSFSGTNNAGLNSLTWNGRIGNQAPSAGTYRIVLNAGGKQYATQVQVEDVSPKL